VQIKRQVGIHVNSQYYYYYYYPNLITTGMSQRILTHLINLSAIFCIISCTRTDARSIYNRSSI